MKAKLREDQKRLQVSNPASGFTVTLDDDCDKHLGGLYAKTFISTKVMNDSSVRVRICPSRKGKHRIVKRTSGNRYAKTRIVDRHNDVKAFPKEFGPTLVRYELKNKYLEFTVPPIQERRKPITRLQKEVKTPLLDILTQEQLSFLEDNQNNLFAEFVEASRKLRQITDKILEDKEVSKLIKERFFEDKKPH